MTWSNCDQNSGIMTWWNCDPHSGIMTRWNCDQLGGIVTRWNCDQVELWDRPVKSLMNTNMNQMENAIKKLQKVEENGVRSKKI